MLLPSEDILDVLQCVDFATLLALRRSGSAFYDVVHRNLSVLPRLRTFDFYLDLATGDHDLSENVEGAFSMVLSASIPYADEFDYSVIHSFADTVGTNFVNSAVITSSIGGMHAMVFDMRKAVETLPALKHIRVLTFRCRFLMRTSHADMELFERLTMSPLENLQRLELGDVKNRTNWAFLRKEWALRLRSLTVEAFHPGDTEIGASGQSEILEYCTDFVHLEKGKSKKLTISGWIISPEFLQRIVTTVSGCKDWLTVVVDGAPTFIGIDADYVRSDLPPESPGLVGLVSLVRYSSRVGSHCVFVRTFANDARIVVTNNPFVTTWDDTYKWDIEGF